MVSPLEGLTAPEPDGSGVGIWPTTVRRINGELFIGGLSLQELASQYGTPVYLLDEEDMRARAAAWKKAANNAFDNLGGADVYYAGKAFLSVAVARAMRDEGLCIDTCSEGELRTALAADVPPARIGLHGNNKSCEEIELALESGIAHLVVDSLAELALIETIAARKKLVAPVMLRVTTGVHAGGHEYISTATEDQKFGLSISGGMARRAIQEAAISRHINLVGLHSHIGSQIHALQGFEIAARSLLELRAEAMKETGMNIPEIDFGGGFGVRYTVLDPIPPAPHDYLAMLAAVVKDVCEEYGQQPPRVIVEPGRSIIGPSGITLYTVGTIKTVQTENGPRRYVSVDGGMSDNIRPALYQADYTVALASRSPSEGIRTRVVGKHCESGDIVVRDVSLSADLAPGDILAVPTTGAYGRSMASNYNHQPRPGVVSVYKGKSRWILRPETTENLLALDADYNHGE